MSEDQGKRLKTVFFSPQTVLRTDRGPRPASEVQVGAKLHGPQGFMEVIEREQIELQCYRVDTQAGSLEVGEDTYIANLGRGGHIYWKQPHRLTDRDYLLQPIAPWVEPQSSPFIREAEGTLADPNLRPDQALYLPVGERVLYLARLLKKANASGHTEGFSYNPDGDLGPEFRVSVSERADMRGIFSFAPTVGARAVSLAGSLLIQLWGPLAKLMSDSLSLLKDPSQEDIVKALESSSWYVLPVASTKISPLGVLPVIRFGFASQGSVEANGFLFLVRG